MGILKGKERLKRFIAGAMTAVMTFTMISIPGAVSSVKAAANQTVYSDLFGSDAHNAVELTSAHDGATLNTGFYYVTKDLKLNEEKTHKNGLKIAESSTVYIYVPKGVTLTVYGKDGANSGEGTDAAAMSIDFKNKTVQEGSKYINTIYMVTNVGPTAGKPGTAPEGGGAAIYVPASAKLILCGDGTVNAIGGNGGDGSAATKGSQSDYSLLSLYNSNTGVKLKVYVDNEDHSGAIYADDKYYPMFYNSDTPLGLIYMYTAYAGAGGAGGNGAAGGGAGIGTDGAGGLTAKEGAVFSTAITTDDTYTKVTDGGNVGSATAGKSAEATGTIYKTSSVTVNAQGGKGGSKIATTYTTRSMKTEKIWMYDSTGNQTTGQFEYYSGSDGLAGGAGGAGANIGTGGGQGEGGLSGKTGMISWRVKTQGTRMGPSENLTTIAKDAENGTAKTIEKATDSETAYGKATFTPKNGADEFTITYKIGEDDTLTIPDYPTEDSTFVGWIISTPGSYIGKDEGESPLLTIKNADNEKLYRKGDVVSTVDVAGTVSFRPVTLSITGEDREIDYQETYNVSNLFSIDTNAGTAKYSVTPLTEGGIPAAGSLKDDGKTLAISHAGKFKVVLTTAANGYYPETETTAYLTVKRPTANITVSQEGFEYGETPKDPVVSGNTSGATETIKYYMDSAFSTLTTTENSGAQTEGGIPKFVGKYYIVYTVGDSADYLGATKNNTFTVTARSIGKADIKIKVDGKETNYSSYDGAKHTASYTVVDTIFGEEKELELGKDYTVDQTSEALTQSESGSYNIAIKGAGNYNNISKGIWSIGGPPITGVSAEGYSGEYDGKAHTITINYAEDSPIWEAETYAAGRKPSGVTVTYSLKENQDFSATHPVLKDVGTTVVYYRISKAGFEDYTSSAVIDITKKQVTLETSADKKVYDGTIDCTTVNAKAASVVSGETITATGLKGRFESKNVGNDIVITVDKTDADIVVTGGSLSNYNVLFAKTKASITAKPVEASCTGVDREYDGTTTVEINGEITSGVILGDDVKVSGGEGKISNKNAGENKQVTVTGLNLTGEDAGNYKLSGNPSTTVNITKRKLTYQITDVEKHIGKSDPKLEYEIVDGTLVDGDTAPAVTLRRDQGEAAGEYSITSTTESVNSTNYEITVKSGIFKISDHLKGSVVKEKVVEPTCSTDGSYEAVYYCTDPDCGKEISRATMTEPRLNHDYASYVVDKEPTCIEEGKRHKVCSRCKAAGDSEVMDALGHKYGDEVVDVEATCTKAGSKSKHCSVCGEKTEIKEIPATGHYFGDFVIEKAATCENKGLKSKHCSRCSATTDETEIDALGHEWDDGVTTKVATCTAAGEKKYTCKNDSTHVKLETVEALGHDWDNGTVVKEATKTDQGKVLYVCLNNAKHTKTEMVDKTNKGNSKTNSGVSAAGGGSNTSDFMDPWLFVFLMVDAMGIVAAIVILRNRKLRRRR